MPFTKIKQKLFYLVTLSIPEKWIALQNLLKNFPSAIGFGCLAFY